MGGLKKFDGNRYQLWKRMAMGFLVKEGVWEVIKNGTESKEKDAVAFTTLGLLIEDDVLMMFIMSPSAKDLWADLEKRYQSSPSTIRRLERELFAAKYAGSMEEYIGRMTTLIFDLEAASQEPIPEMEKCMKLLLGLPEADFDSFIQSFTHGRRKEDWKFFDLCESLLALSRFRLRTSPAPQAVPQRRSRPCKFCGGKHWDSQCPTHICL